MANAGSSATEKPTPSITAVVATSATALGTRSQSLNLKNDDTARPLTTSTPALPLDTNAARDLSYAQCSTNSRRLSGVTPSSLQGYRNRSVGVTGGGIAEVSTVDETPPTYTGGGQSTKFVKRKGSRRESFMGRSHVFSVPVQQNVQTVEERPEIRSSTTGTDVAGPLPGEGGMRRQWSFFNAGAGRKESMFHGGSEVSAQEAGGTTTMPPSQSVKNMVAIPGAAPQPTLFSNIKRRANSHIHTNVFSVGLSLQNTEMSAELNGIADKLTLTFLDSEVEDSFRSYFVRSYMPMWRLGLLIELIFGSILFMYHMLVYPIESDDFLKLQTERLIAYPDFSAWTNVQCIAGYVCERCPRNRLCNDFNPLYETLFFGLSLVLPNLALYVLSYQLGPLTTLSRHTHTISILHTLLICSITVSARHYIVEPTSSAYGSAALYLFFLFESAMIFRVRFLHLVACAPVFVGVFVAEVVGAYNDSHMGSLSSIAISIVMIVCGLCIICLGSYDHERSMRSHFVRSRMYMRTTAKLMDQLKDLNRNYSDQIADFDSPLEKAIAMVKGIRTDPGLGREWFESLGVVLALLNSSDLMTPDIERQVEGGRVALDEEGEAWLFTNLYRGRVRGNSKTNAARRKSAVQGAGESGMVLPLAGNSEPTQTMHPAVAATTGARQVSFSSQSTYETGGGKNGEVRRKKSHVDDESR
ncbi:hypothetical protein BC829DRAFT_133137 [Chytridium lagenaria]|nr:hypothetical protein BC829DRAFT_133137 [Chytridium lagenaria]